MKVLYGLCNGMVMQRGDDNTCAITIGVSDTDALKITYTGPAGTAGIAQVAHLSKLDDVTEVIVAGIPAGGPYKLKLSGNNETVSFENIYVGDVWVLAGQSNMEGVGRLTGEDMQFKADYAVRAFYLNDSWDSARHQLHQLWTSTDQIHVDIWNSWGNPGPCHPKIGVGPGLFFAQKMKSYTGVPQGLICCATGGTSLEQWSPDKRNSAGSSLYGSMLRRFIKNGAHVKGVFWYQGCSETTQQGSTQFESKMHHLISEMRKDFKNENLPIVQVQIARFITNTQDLSDRWWSEIREKQRNLSQSITNLDTISAIDTELDDIIHLCSSSQSKVGERAAESMYNLAFDKTCKMTMPAPAIDDVTIVQDEIREGCNIHVKYCSIHGDLTSKGRPWGFDITKSQDTITENAIYKVELSGDAAVVKTCYTKEQLNGCMLYYGFGNRTYCNIEDSAGRAVPAFGPIDL